MMHALITKPSTFFKKIFDESWEETVDELFNSDIFSKQSTFPKINISEKDGKTLIEVAVPGYQKEDLTINHSNGKLSIYGQSCNTKQNYLVKEIHQRSFSRSFSVGQIENIESFLKDGILHISYITNKNNQLKTIEIK